MLTESNAADVVITVPGQSDVTIAAGSLVALGTDDPAPTKSRACYVGTATIVGAMFPADNTWTVTQGAESTSGAFKTEPAVTDDFTIVYQSCDNNVHFSNGGNSKPWTMKGNWGDVRAYAENPANPPIAGIFFVDDLGYVDGIKVNDTAGTGHGSQPTPGASTAQANPSEYNYTIAYMTCLGMMEDVLSWPEGLMPADTASDTLGDWYNWSPTGSKDDSYLRNMWGREADRVWCYKNLNIFPQFGDHEFRQDEGIQTYDQDDGNAQTSTRYAAGKPIWDSVYGVLQGTSACTLNNSWYADIGGVRLIAPDWITENSGPETESLRQSNNDPALTSASGPVTDTQGTLMSSNSIDELKSTFRFTGRCVLLGMCYSYKYLGDAGGPGSNIANYYNINKQGGQQPILNHYNSNYNSLFTAADGNSLASVLNSQNTPVISLHGDHHYGKVLYHKGLAGSAGRDLDENWCEVCVGTTNGSVNFIQHDDNQNGFPDGWEFDGSSIQYQQGRGGQTVGGYHSLFCEFSGDATTIKLHDWNEQVWAGKFIAGQGNLPILVNEELDMANQKYTTAPQVPALYATGTEMIGCSIPDGNGGYTDGALEINQVNPGLLIRTRAESFSDQLYDFMYAESYTGPFGLPSAQGKFLLTSTITNWKKSLDATKFYYGGSQGTKTLDGFLAFQEGNYFLAITVLLRTAPVTSSATFDLGDPLGGTGMGVSIAGQYATIDASNYLNFPVASSTVQDEIIAIARIINLNDGQLAGKQYVYGVTSGAAEADATEVTQTTISGGTEFTSAWSVANVVSQEFYSLYIFQSPDEPTEARLREAVQYMAENPISGIYPLLYTP